jgi:PTH1 family peptidyl-tRNA hydrolase
VGFDVVDVLARKHGATFRKERFWNALRGRCALGGYDATLLKPLSYVNLTGPVVRKVLEDLGIPEPELMVVVDDFALPLGRIRIRPSGGGGGHNGLTSIVRAVGDGFPRIRIGIGAPEPGEAVDHVLSRFSRDEREVVDKAIGFAAEAVALWASDGLEAAMNRYNSPEGR